MNMGPRTVFDVVTLFVNLIILGMGWKMNAAISELKAHIYEHFMTKKDFSTMNRYSRHTGE